MLLLVDLDGVVYRGRTDDDVMVVTALDTDVDHYSVTVPAGVMRPIAPVWLSELRKSWTSTGVPTLKAVFRAGSERGSERGEG